MYSLYHCLKDLKKTFKFETHKKNDIFRVLGRVTRKYLLTQTIKNNIYERMSRKKAT